MDAFLHNGDFDFSVISSAPAPSASTSSAKAAPKQIKRKQEEINGNNSKNNFKFSNNSTNSTNNETDPAKKSIASNKQGIKYRGNLEEVYSKNYEWWDEGNKKKKKNEIVIPPNKKTKLDENTFIRHESKKVHTLVRTREIDGIKVRFFKPLHTKEEQKKIDRAKRLAAMPEQTEEEKARRFQPKVEERAPQKDFKTNWWYDPKSNWEPDAEDLANQVDTEKDGDAMFTGTFAECGLSDRVISLLTGNMHMKQPTVIQHYAIPQILKGHDVLVKAETGSGKTLTYVLPILNVLGDITPHITRADGVFAIILGPTRELVLQIYEVVQQIAKTWIWVVPGYLSGGENKSSEKTRLRKGLNVLCATPGRLLDHLKTTNSLKFDKLRYLVLDEADRLLDMGLGPQVGDIVSMLKQGVQSTTSTFTFGNRASSAASSSAGASSDDHELDSSVNPSKPKPKPNNPLVQDARNALLYGAMLDGPVKTKREVDVPKNKTIKFDYDDIPATKKHIKMEGKVFQTILASATLHNGVRQLAYMTLFKPIYVGLTPQATLGEKTKRTDVEVGQSYKTPLQLKQFYSIVKTKHRVSALVKVLQECARKKQKAVVFVSCCAVVDYFYKIFIGANANEAEIAPKKRTDKTTSMKEKDKDFKALINAPITKLHGDLTQVERVNSMKKFKEEEGAILLTTDVSARGLDFEDVGWIIQFDPPTDTKDYVHRVGRTARMGRTGNALLFLTHEEEGYVAYLEKMKMVLEYKALEGDKVIEHLLQNYVRNNHDVYPLGRVAYVSAVRAYATHTAATKSIFNVARLHLGHVAKSFCLRDRPAELANTWNKLQQEKAKQKTQNKQRETTTRQFASVEKKKAVTSEFAAGF